jgi:glyoxylase-like metal-dependent hydrolase (beta-lactamase superfamily II)/rhodanese-related sulfurtransferase
MIFKQYYLGCLAHASYLIGDEQTGTAAVVDPQRDIDQYLADAAQSGLRIRHVFLTHFHADFVAGHLELRERTDAAIYLGARAEAEYDYRPVADGDTVEFGRIRLRILETPGHTPEGISILVYDLAQSGERPHAVLTGDTLFIGDVGRPDLLASVGVTADDLAGQLYESLHKKLLPLPDDTLVYPAHGAGSMCGKHLSTDTWSSMGVQRAYNYALQPMSKEAFVKLVTADQPEAPQYFAFDAMLNRSRRGTLRESLAGGLNPLSLDDLLRLREQGSQLLDVRDPADFAGGHLAGSLNISLRGKFATWAGTMLDREKPIVLIAEPGCEEEAAMRLGRIGFDHLAGYLRDGMEALRSRSDLLTRTQRVSAATLAEQLAESAPPTVLDVRTGQEREEHAIAGSRHIPLPRLMDRLRELVGLERIVVHCATGYRSSIAASLMERQGFLNVMDLVGGIEAWEAFVIPSGSQGDHKPVYGVEGTGFGTVAALQ